MWEKISSSLIIKKIFMFISEKKKFNIIIYNKKKFGFNLTDFISMSAKYILDNGFGEFYFLYG